MIYYDRAGLPVSLEDYAALVRIPDYQRVGLDLVGAYRVSTVWLGLDHSFGGGPPLVFETMIFEGDSWDDLACRRYATEAQATRGHEIAVRLARVWSLEGQGVAS